MKIVKEDYKLKNKMAKYNDVQKAFRKDPRFYKTGRVFNKKKKVFYKDVNTEEAILDFLAWCAFKKGR